MVSIAMFAASKSGHGSPRHNICVESLMHYYKQYCKQLLELADLEAWTAYISQLVHCLRVNMHVECRLQGPI